MKILDNKEALQAILNKEKVMSTDGFIYRYENNRIEVKRTKDSWVIAKSFNEGKNFTLVEPNRETITLYEYIADYGSLCFLTDKKESISLRGGENKNSFLRSAHKSKYHKLYRNGECQTVKVYTDTLEYVQEEE